MEEIWKRVIGYEEFYKVSSLGRILRIPKKVTNNFGTFISKEIILKGSISMKGYVKQTLTKNNKQHTLLVHRLVAEAFIQNPEGKPMVNHINGIKDDNRLENLEWVTDSGNMQHALRTKLLIPRNGSDIYFSKFTTEEVKLIKYKFHIENISITNLSEMLDCNRRTIADIIKERTWRHVELTDDIPDLKLFDSLTRNRTNVSTIIKYLKMHNNSVNDNQILQIANIIGIKL